MGPRWVIVGSNGTPQARHLGAYGPYLNAQSAGTFKTTLMSY